MTRPRREELLQLLASGQEGFDKSGEMCVLEGRLYLASLASPPTNREGTIFLALALSSSLCRPHLVFLPHSVFLWVCSLAYTIAY